MYGSCVPILKTCSILKSCPSCLSNVGPKMHYISARNTSRTTKYAKKA